ncbi:hypothetical protein BUZ72_02565, partial [Staphylococcus saprophyticus]
SENRIYTKILLINIRKHKSLNAKVFKFIIENAFLNKYLCYTISIKYNTKTRGASNDDKYSN